MNTVLQIVPNLPPSIDGIGDYALQLARRLRERYQIHSVFIVGDPQWSGSESIEGFSVVRVESRTTNALRGLLHRFGHCDRILLHYVGYGYQDRGIPFWLETALRMETPGSPEKRSSGKRLLTMFHELYASGPITSSAFWLRPFQIRLAHTFVRRSEACFVSNELYRLLIQKAVPDQPVIVVPVSSNFGEPQLTEADLTDRDPQRWIICGGTRLVERSLRSLLPLIPHLPSTFQPTHLDIVGGYRNPAIQALLQAELGFTTAYHPQVTAQQASDLLRKACLAWIDYLSPGQVYPELITKSTAFAACSAHGVLSLFSHPQTSVPSHPAQAHPVTFYLGKEDSRLPDPKQIPSLCLAVYQWYQTHSSTLVITQAYGTVLQKKS